MSVNNSMIKGKKGCGVVYKVENFAFDEDNETISFDAYRFYTPIAELEDSEGFKYFDVDEDLIPLERDDTFNTYFYLIVRTTGNGVTEYFPVLEPADFDIRLGIEGDIVCLGFIPTDPNEAISITLKEVTNG